MRMLRYAGSDAGNRRICPYVSMAHSDIQSCRGSSYDARLIRAGRTLPLFYRQPLLEA